MSGYKQEDPKPVRLVFELARADNPRLYDELVRFPQGAKRVNRLRLLAYDGLLSQYGVFTMGKPGAVLEASLVGPRAEHAKLTNSVFEAGDEA